MKNRILMLLGAALVSTFIPAPVDGQERRRPLEGLRERFKNRPGADNKKGPMQQPGKEIDADGDGIVSNDEILAAVQRGLGELRKNNPEGFKKAMQRFDFDSDGEISMEEALAMHKERQKRMQENGDFQPMSRGNLSENERPGPGRPSQGSDPAQIPVLSDAGLLQGVKIDGFTPPAP